MCTVEVTGLNFRIIKMFRCDYTLTIYHVIKVKIQTSTALLRRIVLIILN